jgi:hypothetical protein
MLMAKQTYGLTIAYRLIIPMIKDNVFILEHNIFQQFPFAMGHVAILRKHRRPLWVSSTTGQFLLSSPRMRLIPSNAPSWRKKKMHLCIEGACWRAGGHLPISVSKTPTRATSGTNAKK